MGKNQNSAMVLRIAAEILVGDTCGCGEQVSQMATYVSKYVKNGLNLPFLEVVWVPKMSMEGSICIGTNLNNEKTPFVAV